MLHAPAFPLTSDLVLVGGGHAHALVLRRWGMEPLPGARVTLVDPDPTAACSGMLPGLVAEMAGRVRGEWVAAALAQMIVPQDRSARMR